ncbi:methyltransferase domain-containing protein [Oceanibium sediminis]|uniref:methyltransferase domain-containing protein n=1 Tax=Oceanibium sediminis TaxID=2026339 RepID=UPI001300A90B|nr:methyltransferase domain-containing protein [Oceanibium sediminis]
MTETAARATTFADRYQSVLVPVIFEPWAQELVRRADPRAGEDILDLACGTGVVARAIAGSGVDIASLTAADHSAEMLEVARALGAGAASDIDWRQADAAHLPFEDASFDLVLCQQALQFFPDKAAALAEVRRVLKPGGRVAFCVQRGLDANPMLQAQANALDAFAGPDAGNAVRAICGLPERDRLHALFEGAGFRDVQIDAVTLTLHHPDARAFAAGAMGGMHTGDKLSGLAHDRIEGAIDAFLQGLGPCFDGTAMRFPHSSHVVLARG